MWTPQKKKKPVGKTLEGEISGYNHLFIQSFLQQIVIESLPRARHSSRCLGHASDKSDKKSLPHGTYIVNN